MVEKKSNKIEEVKEKQPTALQVSVPKLKLAMIKITLEGTSPLLVDNFPAKTREEILLKQEGKTKGKRELRNLDMEFDNAFHKIDKNNFGFPAQGFKSAMIESTSFVGKKDFSKKLLKGIQILNGEGNDLIPLRYKKISKLVHYPKGGNTKISPCFEGWECDLLIQYDTNNISPTDLIELLNYAGFYYGIGIWSPRAKCGGKFGMYKVKINKQM